MEVETSANTYEQDEEVIHMERNNQYQTAVTISPGRRDTIGSIVNVATSKFIHRMLKPKKKKKKKA